MINVASVAAVRPRTLSTLRARFTVPMTGDLWLSNHNSIAATAHTVVPTGVVTQDERAGYGATKQAAPPRGVPR
jgi:hypothetical protein